MPILLKSTKILEAQIDEFLNAVSEGAMVFQQAIKNYLQNNRDKLEQDIVSISTLENRADELRRTIENQLYSHSLIPEHRGDVLGLLESMDNVIDIAKHTLVQFSVESPDIQMALIKDFIHLTEQSAQAAEAIVLATRAFFRDVRAVKDHLHKVYFYEKEADKTSDHLKRRIFSLKIDLARKIHLASFVQHVDSLADRAEAVADRLSIYAIKRSV
jgi:hypothetical protein